MYAKDGEHTVRIVVKNTFLSFDEVVGNAEAEGSARCRSQSCPANAIFSSPKDTTRGSLAASLRFRQSRVVGSTNDVYGLGEDYAWEDAGSPGSCGNSSGEPASPMSPHQPMSPSGYSYSNWPVAQSGDQDSIQRQHFAANGNMRKNLEQMYGTETANTPITTLMIRNIPCRCTKEEVMADVNALGFYGEYDFFYLPRDRRQKSSNLGYAFVNFIDPAVAAEFQKRMSGHRFSAVRGRSQKVCVVVAATVQGLENNLAHFKGTAVIRSVARPCFFNPQEGGNENAARAALGTHHFYSN